MDTSRSSIYRTKMVGTNHCFLSTLEQPEEQRRCTDPNSIQDGRRVMGALVLSHTANSSTTTGHERERASSNATRQETRATVRTSPSNDGHPQDPPSRSTLIARMRRITKSLVSSVVIDADVSTHGDRTSSLIARPSERSSYVSIICLSSSSHRPTRRDNNVRRISSKPNIVEIETSRRRGACRTFEVPSMSTH